MWGGVNTASARQELANAIHHSTKGMQNTPQVCTQPVEGRVHSSHTAISSGQAHLGQLTDSIQCVVNPCNPWWTRAATPVKVSSLQVTSLCMYYCKTLPSDPRCLPAIFTIGSSHRIDYLQQQWYALICQVHILQTCCGIISAA